MDPLTLLSRERLVPQTHSHVFLFASAFILSLLTPACYSVIQSVPYHRHTVYKCNCLYGSATLQLTRTVHTCNNAYSTKTSPKLYSIILWCPTGDYYVTSGSALQSFHHCNCTLQTQTLFSAFQSQI